MNVYKTSLFIALLLFAITLAGPPAFSDSLETVQTEADRDYLKGVEAFQAGDDKAAADLFIEAAREDRRCVSLLRDGEWASADSPNPCSGLGPGQVTVAGDPAAEVLYHLAVIRKESVRSQQGEAESRKAGRYLLSRAATDYQGSPWADLASLLIVEDGFCLDSAGYPDCLVLEIREYERWLTGHPVSSHKAYVLKSLSERYLALADKYDEQKPWKLAIKAEICRGRAMEIAQAVEREYKGTEYGEWAHDFVRKIKDSGKPYSVVPQAAIPGRER